MPESNKPENGDIIKFTWKGKEMEGTFISIDSDFFNVKLENGYNISIKPQSFEIIKKGVSFAVNEGKGAKVSGKGKPISLITTGGTIVSKVDYRTGAVFPSLDIEELTSRFRYMEQNYRLKRVDFSNILSENIEPGQWVEIAKKTEHELRNSEGVVISHGTDTMSYTASALAFMFEKQMGPVILVGSQRSSDRPSSDSYLNLEAAVGFATSEFGEVGISMHHNSSDERIDLIRGTRSRKMHSTRRDAFKSIGEHPVGAFQDGLFSLSGKYRRKCGENVLKTKLEKKVSLVYFHPGLEVEDLEKSMDGKKGMVIMGTGLGHINTKYFQSISERVKGGMKAVATTQCIYGSTNLDIYSTGREMEKAGIVSAGNILPETAYVKMMYLLGNYSEEEFEVLMKTNMRGEILEREELGVYL
ncbi:MAG: Glu-tRNA(Gln) amidotransferase subunit GatD [Candidatus Thermoplasmatota archaeon]|nr:Glu-tRNA(Gln) amidotransferase subunit GatD [Candidatus Thermoplasmatota archaeon]